MVEERRTARGKTPKVISRSVKKRPKPVTRDALYAEANRPLRSFEMARNNSLLAAFGPPARRVQRSCDQLATLDPFEPDQKLHNTLDTRFKTQYYLPIDEQ